MEQSQSLSATPGSIRHLPNYVLFDYWAKNIVQTDVLNENDTYIYIFNLKKTNWTSGREENNARQIEYYKALINHPKIKVIWESEMAVNRNDGHGTFPRNKMVVFEYVKNPEPINAA